MKKIQTQKYRHEMDSITRLTIRWFIAIVLFLLLLLSLGSCGGGDSGGSGGGGYAITLAITNATSNDVQFSITASFNAFSTPVWRTDKAWYIATIDLQSNTPYTYIDSNVNPGTQYCYRVGGEFFLHGPIYSNKECVTTPA